MPAPKSDRNSSTSSRKRGASASSKTGGPGRRKSCFFCKSKVDEVDYKNVNELRRYVSEKGKIRSRRKDQTGQWVEKPNYFDVTVWGQQGENCAQYLAKGRSVGVDGRLEWREWDGPDGQKRQAVEIIADSVQFLGGRGEGEGFGGQGSQGGGNQFVPAGAAQGSDADFQGADDDIPF